jgi:hypothetical protein
MARSFCRFPLSTSPFLAACVLAGLAAAAQADSPRDELLRYVPEDVGFCLVLQDMRGHAAALRESPFAEQFWRSPPGKVLGGSKELGQLDKVDRQLRTTLGVGWKTFAEDILGDAVVFAYRPGPPGEPDKEQGLILLRARNADALAKLVDGINNLQKLTGELVALENRTHNGVRYVTRVEAGKKTSFYLLSGSILLYSGQEDMLRRAIDQKASGPAVAPISRRLTELGIERSVVAVWVNPRAFDAAIAADLRKAEAAPEQPARAAGLRQFSLYWKALDSIGFAMDLGRDLSLSLAVRARTEELPPAARRFLKETSRPSALWASFPEEPLLAVAGRIDPAALFEVVADFLPEAERRRAREKLDHGLGAILGKDLVKDILPALGPDWGFCLAAPAARPGAGAGPAWFPEAFLAVRVTRKEEEAPVDQAILSALVFGARLLVLGHNKDHPDKPLSFKTARHGKAPVHYLTGRAFPPGVRPALSLIPGPGGEGSGPQAGFLVLASSPEVLSRLNLGAAGKEPGPADAKGVPLLRISFRQWRAYLTTHRKAIARTVAAKNDLDPAEADRRLGHLLEALPFLDRLEVRQRTAPGRMTLTLSVRPSRPLRK